MGDSNAPWGSMRGQGGAHGPTRGLAFALWALSGQGLSITATWGWAGASEVMQAQAGAAVAMWGQAAVGQGLLKPGGLSMGLGRGQAGVTGQAGARVAIRGRAGPGVARQCRAGVTGREVAGVARQLAVHVTQNRASCQRRAGALPPLQGRHCPMYCGLRPRLPSPDEALPIGGGYGGLPLQALGWGVRPRFSSCPSCTGPAGR